MLSNILTAFLNSALIAVCVCGNPVIPGDVTASDALYALRAAVGSGKCSPCACDVNNDSFISATDALIILKYAVGQEIILVCPVQTTTTTSLQIVTTTTLSNPTTTVTQIFTTTTLINPTTTLPNITTTLLNPTTTTNQQVTTTSLDCLHTTTTLDRPGYPTLVCGCGWRLKDYGCRPDPCNLCCKSCTSNGWEPALCPDLLTLTAWGPDTCLGIP